MRPSEPRVLGLLDVTFWKQSMRFQYVTISVSNLEKSKEFYSDLLGFKESHAYERWIGYELEQGAGIGIIEDPNFKERPSSDIINLVSDNFEEYWNIVKEKVPVDLPPTTMPWGTRKFVVLDPDQTRIGFIEDRQNLQT